MARIILERLLIAVPVLFVVSVLTFVLVSLLPGDAAQALLGPDATAAQIEVLRTELGLDRPPHERYLNWLGSALQGDLGTSLVSRQPVTDILNTRLPVTLTVVILTTALATILGSSLGFFSALRGGAAGKLVDVLTFVGYAFPGFFIALGLVAIFAVQLRFLPPNGFVSIQSSIVGWARSLVLPITALALASFAEIATQTRDAALNALSGDFVRVQFANGLSRRSIAWKHVLRSSLPPVLTVIGLIFVNLMSGAVLVEQVFALPGIGQQVVVATTNRDIPIIQGAVVYLTIIVLLVNLIIDIAYGLVDPRVRVR